MKSIKSSQPKFPSRPRFGRSLLERYPNVAKEWDYDKNYPLKPNNVSYGTTFKAHWICPKGHRYLMQINNRTSSQASECPYCSPAGNKVWEGNCLSTVCPDLAKEWHPSKNNGLKPSDVTYASPQKVWWICSSGHEWQSSVYERSLSKIKNKNRGKCPYCSGKRVGQDNCLSTIYPQISKEWHPIKNGADKPTTVTAFSGKKVWWICSSGHEWKTGICHRTIDGTGCPICSKIVLKDGTKCDSVTEAYFYLKFKERDGDIRHHIKQNILGSKRCFIFDFYFPKENKYVEVAGFGVRWMRVWENYFRRINEKKKYVENVLGAKFEFLQKKLKPEEIQYVRRSMA